MVFFGLSIFLNVMISISYNDCSCQKVFHCWNFEKVLKQRYISKLQNQDGVLSFPCFFSSLSFLFTKFVPFFLPFPFFFLTIFLSLLFFFLLFLFLTLFIFRSLFSFFLFFSFFLSLSIVRPLSYRVNTTYIFNPSSFIIFQKGKYTFMDLNPHHWKAEKLKGKNYLHGILTARFFYWKSTTSISYGSPSKFNLQAILEEIIRFHLWYACSIFRCLALSHLFFINFLKTLIHSTSLKFNESSVN